MNNSNENTCTSSIARRLNDFDVKQDDGGFEAIFDAILFLTILGIGAILLQTTLLSSLQKSELDNITENSNQVRSSMEVFLRTWVYYDSEGDGEDLLRGDVSSVINEAIHQKRTGELSQTHYNEISEHLDSLLTSIITPSYEYQFTANYHGGVMDEELILGYDLPEGRNVYYANGDWDVLAIGSGDSGEMVTFELAIWII